MTIADPISERERLTILREYDILDTLPEEAFDDITRIASEICQTPISLVTLIDEDRQWFKSHHGLDILETPREYSFCSLAIENPEEPFIVTDFRNDRRFDDNPFVYGEPYVMFYAGIPLVTSDGYALGSLCVIDHHPKMISEQQIASLKALANQVVAQLELRRKIKQLKLAQEQLEVANQDLKNFAQKTSHDIKGPLRLICSYSTIVKRSLSNSRNKEDKEIEMLDFIHDSSLKLYNLVDGILELSKASSKVMQKIETINLSDLLKETISLISPPANFTFEYAQNLPQIKASKAGLQQVLLNLLSNAVRYNNKAQGLVKINFSQDEAYKFQVTDNGIGIAPEDHKKIFQVLQTLGKEDQFGNIGTGIGLATVKRILEKLHGNITVESELNKGTTFSFWIPV